MKKTQGITYENTSENNIGKKHRKQTQEKHIGKLIGKHILKNIGKTHMNSLQENTQEKT